jgi:3-oxoacyl-[acyl-carrier-protein] synthase II
MNQPRRVVITGLGVASPLGIGADAFWDALIQRKSAIAPIQAFDASELPSKVGAELPDFKLSDFVPKSYRKSTKLTSRDIQIAVIASYEAVKDANLPTKCIVERGETENGSLNPQGLGANIGAGLICPDLNELGAAFATSINNNNEFDLNKWGDEAINNLTPLWLLKYLPNMLACHVTIIHDAQAMSNTITCGEASSHLAVGEAFRNIARGAMDVCICGGAESKINPMGVARPALMNRLVTGNPTDPTSACRPFAKGRRGTVAAEGGGLLILESLDHAKQRNARIYAELVGFGASGNTKSWDAPDESGAPLTIAIKKALADANLTPPDIGLLSTFGCGLIDHDAAENRAWNTVFGSSVADIPALAIKGATGNNGAGSGAIDLCAAVLALHYNTVPPSLNTDPPADECHLRFATADPVDAPIDAVVSVAYALGGGQNASLVFKRFTE